MEYLWSPWRMDYIQSHNINDECIFCFALSQTDSINNLIIIRGKHVYVMLNRYPYTSGHLMIVPLNHIASLDDMGSEASFEMMEFTKIAIRVLKKEYQPQGFNIGINIGEAAGAGIIGHVHLHIVPRWRGDTNFISTLASTRVLPESLEETYVRLKRSWSIQSNND